MAELDSRYLKKTEASPNQQKVTKQSSWMGQWWFLLLAAFFFAEIIMPIILWKAGLPGSMDFLREILAGVMIGIALSFMLLRNHIPKALLIILAVTLIWGAIAMLSGQTLGATIWGWWRIFKYPMLMFFAYLVPDWPKDFPRWFFKFLVILLMFEVVVQLAQFATGQAIGDNLAGTFGAKGVGQYTNLLFFTVCLTLGYWSVTGDWKTLLFVLGLGLVASTLNETKFYVIGVLLLGIGAIVLHFLRGGRVRHILVYITLIALTLGIFVPIYNRVVVPNVYYGKPLQDYFTAENIQGYLFINDMSEFGRIYNYGQYHFGRGQSVSYAWELIQNDPVNTLFGFGLGSRTYSAVLGVYGHSLLVDIYNIPTMSDLGTWMLEFGLVGLLLFFIVNLWIIVKLYRHAKTASDKYLAALEYGLILFTFFWPLWLFYHTPWYFGGMMTFYWLIMGYVFQQINKPHNRARSKYIVGDQKPNELHTMPVEI